MFKGCLKALALSKLSLSNLLRVLLQFKAVMTNADCVLLVATSCNLCTNKGAKPELCTVINVFWKVKNFFLCGCRRPQHQGTVKFQLLNSVWLAVYCISEVALPILTVYTVQLVLFVIITFQNLQYLFYAPRGRKPANFSALKIMNINFKLLLHARYQFLIFCSIFRESKSFTMSAQTSPSAGIIGLYKYIKKAPSTLL